MKKLILIMFGIILGVSIYNMILGNDSDSLKTKMKDIFQYQIDDFKEG